MEGQHASFKSFAKQDKFLFSPNRAFLARFTVGEERTAKIPNENTLRLLCEVTAHCLLSAAGAQGQAQGFSGYALSTEALLKTAAKLARRAEPAEGPRSPFWIFGGSPQASMKVGQLLPTGG